MGLDNRDFLYLWFILPWFREVIEKKMFSNIFILIPVTHQEKILKSPHA